MRFKSALMLAASCLMLGAAPAFAQSSQDVEKAPPVQAAKAKAKKKAKTAKGKAAKGKTAPEIVVMNARADGIVTVMLTTAKGKSIAVVKKSLPPGTKHAMKLPAGSGCEFTVSARFVDGSEFEPTAVNLCMDKTVRFTDGDTLPAEAPAPATED